MAANGANADPTLHSPRILCLHGGGVTGEVFVRLPGAPSQQAAQPR
ncbi:MAG: hypothetical protein INR71_07285 [Terriglobus roseus]|nr:hypothetical protein [Terriglobus roseus]